MCLLKCTNNTLKEEYKKFESFRINWIVFVHHNLVFHFQEAAALWVSVYGQAHQGRVCQVPADLLQAPHLLVAEDHEGSPLSLGGGVNLHL